MKAARAQCRISIRCGAQLDLLCVYFVCCFDLFCVGIDKETGENSSLSQPAYGSAHDGNICRYVQSAFSSYFIWTFRNERHRIRAYLECDLQHLFSCRHLEIHIGGDGLAQGANVVVLNVTAVAAQVNGDAVRAGLFAKHGGGDNAGLRRAPRLAHSCDVIDIDVQSCSHFFFLRLTTLCFLVFRHASVIASPNVSPSTAAKSTVVNPCHPQAPLAGTNASGPSRKNSCCCYGVNLTIPDSFPGRSVAKIRPLARKSGWPMCALSMVSSIA